MTGTRILSPDRETVVLPDDAEIIPCEIAPRHPEAVAAHWALVHACGATTLVCNPCKELCDEEIEATPPWIRYRCTTCESVVDAPLPWVHI